VQQELTDPAWQHFEIDFENKQFQCQICKQVFNYSTLSPYVDTAKNHLGRFHAKELGIPEITASFHKRNSDPVWLQYEIDGKNKIWHCRLCGQEFKYSSKGPNIQTARKHLELYHEEKMRILEKKGKSGLNHEARKSPDS
jgi:ribosomal protein L37AE/L43A